MIRELRTDVVVLGGGPAGLAAAQAARGAGARCLIIEREERLGGILKQCVDDGFGLVRYGAPRSGPEYAAREAARARAAGSDELLEAFVTRLARADTGGFELDCVSRAGAARVRAGALVLATGCRERTDRQVFIHGDRKSVV